MISTVKNTQLAIAPNVLSFERHLTETEGAQDSPETIDLMHMMGRQLNIAIAATDDIVLLTAIVKSDIITVENLRNPRFVDYQRQLHQLYEDFSPNYNSAYKGSLPPAAEAVFLSRKQAIEAQFKDLNIDDIHHDAIVAYRNFVTPIYRESYDLLVNLSEPVPAEVASSTGPIAIAAISAYSIAA